MRNPRFIKGKDIMLWVSAKSAIEKMICERAGVKSAHIEGRNMRNRFRTRLNISREG